MLKKFVTLSLVLIFVGLILRKPDKIVKLSQMTNTAFSNIWLSLVKTK